MARHFNNSTSNYLSANTGTTGLISSLSTAFTVAGWANHASAQLGQIYAEGEPAGNNIIQIGLNATHNAFLVVKRSTQASANSSTATSTGTWAHVCGVQATMSSRICYLNGGGGVTDTTVLSGSISTTKTRIGVLETGSRFNPFDGNLAHVAIWNVALDANEANALAKGVSPLQVRPASLLGYWPLNGLNSPENNFLGNGTSTFPTMTINGTVTRADNPPMFLPKRRFSRKVRATPATGLPMGLIYPTRMEPWMGDDNAWLDDL